jgi:predicted CXXCH cytochrome family protein
MLRKSSIGSRSIGLALTFALLLLAGIFLLLSQPSNVSANVEPAPKLQGGQTTNDICLGCHSKPGQTFKLASGEILDITVDPAAYKAGVHGSQDLACTQCHTNITGFPHPDLTVKSRKEYTLQYQQTCKNCHDKEFLANQDSMHYQKLAGGDLDAPTCSSCHNSHTQQKVTDGHGHLLAAARTWVPQTCAKCHNAIFEQYKDSVHGQGVLDGSNPDVPTCTDCHGVHNISNPNTTQFRINSPKICANCHTNAAIMGKYNISTQVLNTYVADFHGTTVTLFQKTRPDQQTNKPVCYDCHGVHNIAKVDDPQKGLKIKENMLVACKKCHPDATTNFPSSWLSHYIPDTKNYPLVFYVQWFYYILIPVVLGGMALFVLTDVYRRLFLRRKLAKQQPDKMKAE